MLRKIIAALIHSNISRSRNAANSDLQHKLDDDDYFDDDDDDGVGCGFGIENRSMLYGSQLSICTRIHSSNRKMNPIFGRTDLRLSFCERYVLYIHKYYANNKLSPRISLYATGAFAEKLYRRKVVLQMLCDKLRQHCCMIGEVLLKLARL